MAFQSEITVHSLPGFAGTLRSTTNNESGLINTGAPICFHHWSSQINSPTQKFSMLKSSLLVATLFWLSLNAALAETKITPDVVYGHKFGLALTFDVFKPETNSNGAGVLFMVSGGWYSNWSPPEQAQAMFLPLTNAGYTVFAVRHGSSPKFSIPEAVEDVRRSVRFIRLNADKFGIDGERLGVFGMSAGGHLSLMLGTAAMKAIPRRQIRFCKSAIVCKRSQPGLLQPI
jgi:acetyl esterase/lipase